VSDLTYVRLFAGPDGESHFEDVAVEFMAEPPQPFLVSAWQSAERVRFLRFTPGFQGGTHLAPFRQFLVCLTGSYAMQTSDREIRYFKPGDVLLVEDTTGKGHTTWNEGTGVAVAARIQVPG
jgi:hypothetical protein